MIELMSRARNITGYAILTDADHDVGGNMDQRQQKPTFQVILTYMDDDGFVRACTYSSATNSWSAPSSVARLPGSFVVDRSPVSLFAAPRIGCTEIMITSTPLA
jgi:hypothetical protein